MKQLILILTILFSLNATAQEFTLVEINAKWKNKLFLIKLIKPNELF